MSRLQALKSTVNYDSQPESTKAVFDMAWQFQQQEIDRVTMVADRDRGTAANILITLLAQKCSQLQNSKENANIVTKAAAFIFYLLEQTPDIRIQHDKTIAEIQAAIEGYYKALSSRQNGTVARDQAFANIEDILGMRWNQREKFKEVANHDGVK